MNSSEKSGSVGNKGSSGLIVTSPVQVSKEEKKSLINDFQCNIILLVVTFLFGLVLLILICMEELDGRRIVVVVIAALTMFTTGFGLMYMLCCHMQFQDWRFTIEENLPEEAKLGFRSPPRDREDRRSKKEGG